MPRALAVLLAVALGPTVARAAPAMPKDEATGVVANPGCRPFWPLAEGEKPRAGAKYCDPTQEKLTLLALRRGRLVPETAAAGAKEARELFAGLLWNDDPDGELAKSPARWAADFTKAEKASAAGQTFGPGAPLVARSHFGDLQPLHAMSGRFGENPWVVYGAVIRWTELLFKVADGEIDAATPLAKVPVAGFPELFPRRPETTVAELLGARGKGADPRARALGALLHLVEDAFLPGHVHREEMAGSAGGILAYASNEKAAGDHHRKDDGWREAWKDGASLWQVAGAREALQAAGDAIWLVRGHRGWNFAKRYFDLRVFSISGIPPPPGFQKPGSAAALR